MDTVVSGSAIEHDHDYTGLEKSVALIIASCERQLFTTDVKPEKLWEAFLGGLPEAKRQHYNCLCCRKFIERFGGLVTIDDNSGGFWPLFWSAPNSLFAESQDAMLEQIGYARVNGVFLCGDQVWGTPGPTVSKKSGTPWTHLGGPVSKKLWWSSVSQTAEQAMAERLEDFKMLNHALAEYNHDVVASAVRILQADALDRSEKTLGNAEWFLTLHGKIAGRSSEARRNIVWFAVATAPAGFCHVRTNMIHTLMDDLKSGMEFEEIKRRWANKMHPGRYQRPQAAPSDGQIEAAEKLVEKLDLARSLERRAATIADVTKYGKFLWLPMAEKVEEKKGGGVFDDLRSDKAKLSPIELPVQKMTWAKFTRDVLGHVIDMKCLAVGHGNYFGLVTAAHEDAPPILQWDLAEQRNPCSAFSVIGGSFASDWGLVANTFVDVVAVFPLPWAWSDRKFDNQMNRGVLFALSGAWRESSLALFPETLKSELHGVRAVIEAHMKKRNAANPEAGNANGIVMTDTSPVTLKVRTDAGIANYIIDRWE